MRLVAMVVSVSAVLYASSCSNTSTCYSYCSDSAAIAVACADAGAVAQCSSATVQPFSGSTTVNGLSLDYCTSYTNDAGVFVDGGCTPPTFECVSTGCKQNFDCEQVPNCTF